MPIVPAFSPDVKKNPLLLRGQLALLGWASLKDWAITMGYETHQVRMTLKKFRDERSICSELGHSILKDLDTTLTAGITPESIAGEAHACPN